MKTDYTNRELQELRVLVYFKYLYTKYTKENEIYATEKNFKDFGELTMRLAASIFENELVCNFNDIYPPKDNFDLVSIMFSLTDKYLTHGDDKCKEIAKIFADGIVFNDIKITSMFEREAINQDVIMRMGSSNVRFLDNSWGRLLDSSASLY